MFEDGILPPAVPQSSSVAVSASLTIAAPPLTVDPVVRVLTTVQIDHQVEAAWHKLDRRARDCSPFQSPHFLLPSLEHFRGGDARLLLIESGEELIGAGLFSHVASSRHLPLPHLRALQTPHSFLDSFMLRPGLEQLACRALWRFFEGEDQPWHGVLFPRLDCRSEGTRLLQQTAEAAGVEVWRGTKRERAALCLDNPDPTHLQRGLSKRRRRSLHRGRIWLERQGPISLQIHDSPQDVVRCTDELLRLESLGWKADIGTALASNESHLRFFRDMVARFCEQGRVFFTELKVGERTAAMVCYLRSGERACAFKIGWDPDFARGCPGFQIKAELFQHTLRLPGIRLIDSCSSPGSFIEHIWPDRIPIAMHLFLAGRTAVIGRSMIDGLSWICHQASRFVWEDRP